MEEHTNIDSQPNGDAKPTAPIRLTHAALVTSTLENSIHFYVNVLGLRLRCKEEDPLRPGRMRAMLTDKDEQDIIELIEFPEMPHASVPGRGAIHHVGFCLPQRDWHALRSRLDAAGYPYQEIENRLFIRDADSVVLEIEVNAH
ncbi:MAG: VOC family protein [Rhodothermaceae bacterium]|nr:VOC family protein [Rhodothermaceae bacterium]